MCANVMGKEARERAREERSAREEDGRKKSEGRRLGVYSVCENIEEDCSASVCESRLQLSACEEEEEEEEREKVSQHEGQRLCLCCASVNVYSCMSGNRGVPGSPVFTDRKCLSRQKGRNLTAPHGKHWESGHTQNTHTRNSVKRGI